MEKLKTRVGLVLALMVCGLAQAGEAWRWMENGKWVYGDKYPTGVSSAEKVSTLAMPPVEKAAAPYALVLQNDKAAQHFPVKLYGVGCPGCEAAKKILESRKIPFAIKDTNNQDVFVEFKKYSPQSMAPVVLIGDTVLIGFEEGSMNGALDDAGYGKAKAVAGPAPQAPAMKK